jgi:hypothetical protein
MLTSYGQFIHTRNGQESSSRHEGLRSCSLLSSAETVREDATV